MKDSSIFSDRLNLIIFENLLTQGKLTAFTVDNSTNMIEAVLVGMLYCMIFLKSSDNQTTMESFQIL